MKGVTKAVVLDLETSGVITDPWGKQRTGFSLNGKIKRTDLEIFLFIFRSKIFKVHHTAHQIIEAELAVY